MRHDQISSWTDGSPIWPEIAALAVALVLLPAARHFPAADRSHTTLVADYGKALLDGMKEGALYFPSSDHST